MCVRAANVMAESQPGHMLISAAAIVSVRACVCVCVFALLRSLAVRSLALWLCVLCACLHRMGRQNVLCAPHCFLVSCQTCWKKVRLTFCSLTHSLYFEFIFVSYFYFAPVLLLVIVVVVILCVGVQLDYVLGARRIKRARMSKRQL